MRMIIVVIVERLQLLAVGLLPCKDYRTAPALVEWITVLRAQHAEYHLPACGTGVYQITTLWYRHRRQQWPGFHF